jgi:Flp pilus assembly protein TadG
VRSAVPPDGPCERGATAVEFSLVATAFLLLVIGLMDLTMSLFSVNAVTSASRDGARAAAAWKGTDPSATADCPGISTMTFGADGDATEARRILCFTLDKVYMSGTNEVRARIQFEDSDGLPLSRGSVVPSQSAFAVVCVQARFRSVSGLLAPLLNSRVQSTSARMRLEESAPLRSTTGSVINPRTFNIAEGGQPLFDPNKPC